MPGRNGRPNFPITPNIAVHQPKPERAASIASGKLHAPEDITFVLLPSRSPELNPQENIWQFLGDNWPSNRMFSSHEALRVIAPTLGTSSWNSPGASCPLDSALGSKGSNQ
jgi:hypothetical protein